ncbi:hypothetical protein [Roseibium sp. RKSG952]|uniref:hypothetical protein n=1 Tax=Roseibium sp. RKSG952 TaxID=2529384 RepID=UPI0018AD195D|nr:hypothetical protein [Roseibium sp. RKSG952]
MRPGHPHVPTTTTTTREPVTEIAFCAWIAQSTPGDRLEYHRGFLALDAYPMFSRLTDAARKELQRLGTRAFWAAEQDLVHLLQKRIGEERFSYIAVARPKAKVPVIPFSDLVPGNTAPLASSPSPTASN